MAIVCDACHCKIKPKPIEKKIGRGVRETYFNCSECGKKYTAFMTDQSIRRKQRKVKKLVEDRKKSKSPEEFVRRTEEISALKNVIKLEMDKLMGRN